MDKNTESFTITWRVVRLTEQHRKVLLAEGEKTTFITLLCNILLTIFKTLTGIFIGSISLLASGLDALTDLIASLAVLIGLRYSQKDPSKRFSYGYYRMETLATLVVSILILFFGISVILESINIIITPKTLNQPVFGLLMALISMVTALGLYLYNLKIGTKISSNAMIGAAKEFKLDILTNLLVFLGIFAYIIEIPQLEGLIGLLIGVLIIKTGVEFGKNSLLVLLDAIDDPDVIENIRSIVIQSPEVLKVSNIRVRRSGPYYFADIEILMQETETVKSLTQLTHKLESSLKAEISQLDSIMISVEPIEKTRFKVAIAVPSLDTSTDNSPAEHFGMAPAFLIADIDIPSRSILSTRIIENPHIQAERKRGILSAEFLVNEKIDVLSVKNPEEFGIGPKAIFSDNNVLIEPFHGDNIKEILEGFIDSRIITQ